MSCNLQPSTSILSSGTVLRGQFVVDRVLTTTELSTIYLGWDRGRGWHERRVVIKRLSTAPEPGGRLRAEAICAFRQEIALLASLNHPQFPRLRAAFRRGDDYYIVMNYITGVPLDSLVERGPLSLDVTLAVADGLCDAVTQLHRKRPPIIHADIKPSNVLITAEGRVVLLDLGVARPRDPMRWDNAPIGTLPYAPPEQRCGEPLDERSDLYALGVLLRELFGPAARHPILRYALHIATAAHPDDRFASVRQFQRALHGEDDVLSVSAAG